MFGDAPDGRRQLPLLVRRRHDHQLFVASRLATNRSNTSAARSPPFPHNPTILKNCDFSVCDFGQNQQAKTKSRQYTRPDGHNRPTEGSAASFGNIQIHIKLHRLKHLENAIWQSSPSAPAPSTSDSARLTLLSVWSRKKQLLPLPTTRWMAVVSGSSRQQSHQ